MPPSDLYHDQLLTLARFARQQSPLPIAHITHKAEAHNPSCGDRAEAHLHIANSRLLGLALHSDGCAICQASAGLLLQIIALPCATENLTVLLADLDAWLADSTTAKTHWDVFSAVKSHYRNRQSCVRLPFVAANSAMQSPVSGGR